MRNVLRRVEIWKLGSNYYKSEKKRKEKEKKQGAGDIAREDNDRVERYRLLVPGRGTFVSVVSREISSPVNKNALINGRAWSRRERNLKELNNSSATVSRK